MSPYHITSQIRPLIASLLLPVLLFVPGLSQAQNTNVTSITTGLNLSIAALGGAAEALNGLGTISMPTSETTDWQNALSGSGDINNYDRRVTTQLLPWLVDPNGGGLSSVVVDRIRRGYTEVKDQNSRTTDTTDTISPHYYGKAVSLAAAGSTSCSREVLFPQSASVSKPLWLSAAATNTGNSPDQTKTWPFGRSYDRLTHQYFWLEGRGLTNQPSSASGWPEWLKQIATAEIEDRFALPNGSLANYSITQLPNAIARLRLASSLGLTSLPIATDETSFYTAIGQHSLENELDLPVDSFKGATWQAIYQRLGFRVLEEELGIAAPTETDTDLFSADSNRQKVLAAALTRHGTTYQNKRIGLNLPPDSYIEDNSGSDLFDRLTNGDPDSFSLVGAYFLADSLELSPASTKDFLSKLTAHGYNLVVPLRDARPVNPDLEPDKIFVDNPADLGSILFRDGQSLEPIIESNLARLNESVLQSVNSNYKTPSLSSMIALLTNPSNLKQTLTTLSQSSIEDANYTSPLTAAQLLDRGRVRFTDFLTTNNGQTFLPADIANLESGLPGDENAGAVSLAIDQLMGWPTGTASAVLNTKGGSFTDAQLVTIGGQKLWSRLGLSQQTIDGLAAYFINHQLPGSDASILPGTDSSTITTTNTTNLPGTNSNSSSTTDLPGQSNDNTDQPVEFLNLSTNSKKLFNDVTTGLNIPLVDTDLIIDGRMKPALSRATLTTLGETIKDQYSSAQNADLYRQLSALPGTDSTTEATSDATAIDEIIKDTPISLVTDDFFPNLTKGLRETNLYLTWRSLHDQAIYQWNTDCGDKSVEVKTVLTSLLDKLVSLPEDKSGTAESLSRPVQILTFDSSLLGGDLSSKIRAAYPGADGVSAKWGVYGDVQRTWDHLYIGY